MAFPNQIGAAPWTETEIAVAERMWGEGHSAAEISRSLQMQFQTDRSRNGILGLMNRYRDRFPFRGRGVHNTVAGIQRKSKEKIVAVAAKPVVRRKPEVERAVVKPAEPIVFQDPMRVPLVAVGNGCRWPVNDAADPADHLFCGLTTVESKTYCRHHLLRSFGRGTEGERSADRVLIKAVSA